MSNIDRLREAGIIPPGRKLSKDQRQAIDGLSKKDVDDLIHINKRLQDDIEDEDDPLMILPGRIAGQSQSDY